MSEKKKEAAPPAAPAEGTPKKGGLPIKTIAVVAVVMVVEAVAVFLVFSMMAPKPTQAHVDPATVHEDDSDQTAEIAIVSESAESKFQNMQTGKVWLWELNIYVQVKNKHAEKVETILAARKAEIQEEISRIVARAQHPQLKEPDRATLNRLITASLNRVFGTDDNQKPLIERVLIPLCRGWDTTG